ncbi:hypothetical protein AYL99_04894 [Fonsecaea erecta]|uniref:Uncharacterized protein n=1 Tax=Fonsecaea erecta TaxID=1367422 RepID=A0A178ZJP2_9EURO|nr:hypothetical protein AYL99_04894 [Fonsecaea erecta]OAP59892.1 hypothetical protein AYL99_04894 [Fonsecaea erecta]
MLDISRILILYTHHHATPVIAHLHGAEHNSRCITFPTPKDPSLTVVPNWQQSTMTMFGRKSNCDAPTLSARPVSTVPVTTNAEVVLALLYIWNRGLVPLHHHHHHHHHNNSCPGDLKLEVIDDWEADFGRTKILWQKVEDRIHNHSLDEHNAMLEF